MCNTCERLKKTEVTRLAKMWGPSHSEEPGDEAMFSKYSMSMRMYVDMLEQAHIISYFIGANVNTNQLLE